MPDYRKKIGIKDKPLALKTPPGTSRFAMYVPPLMEHLGLAEVEHNARDNRMRYKTKSGKAK